MSDLIEQTISMVAERGADSMSLRTIAANAGCSTAYIFQKFGNKDGLVSAAIVHARQWEAAFHEGIARQIDGIIFDHHSIADLISYYVDRRATQPIPRFLSSLLANVRYSTSHVGALREWRAIRRGFWREIFSNCACPASLSGIVSAYISMEEFYAFALYDSPRYSLLLKETARGLTTSIRPAAEHASAAINLVSSLNVVPLPSSSPPSPRDSANLREAILKHGVDEIIGHGIEALNQRRIARLAGISGSAIAYHFGDMERFVNEAIWRALIRDIPHDLDPTQNIDGELGSMEDWLALLSLYMRPRRSAAGVGFYTSYARITAQTCLLVKTRPTLMPLVEYLRELDGWGTYRASRNVSQPAVQIGRDHAAAFAIWMKGVALLSDSAVCEESITPDILIAGANVVFPKRS